ncbi:hypothetical protein GCM10010840_27660 [Deinococcus aerolatus]|uniref:Uncharacterized protein n=2 Tax=Deinococcus aerolatus TaxID=522487 RepID=A0ABQ2GE15_9DEIO|nr:hypothetical protein GCM10010840_27660 [Deinococcus aerolatus]
MPPALPGAPVTNMIGPDTQRWLVVRVWLEPDGAQGKWRASVRRDDQHRYFTSPEALIAYLAAAIQST